MSSSKEFSGVSNIRMVVFDIDGTIADTANLVPYKQRRKPDDILKLLEPSAVDSDLIRIKNIRRMTSNFNRCGIRVAVISSAPAAYVGTMCFLMGVEADTIIASNTEPGLTTKADRLLWLASTPRYEEFDEEFDTSISMKDLLYVGDLSEDAVAAQSAGCLYQNIEEYLNDAEQLSQLSRLEKRCEDIVSGNLPLADESHNWHMGAFEAGKEWQLEYLHGVSESWYGIDISNPDATMDDLIRSGLFNPFKPNSPIQRPLLDPSFMTREEYQNDWDIKCKLFEAIANSHPAQLQQFDETFSYLSKIKTYAHLYYWNSRLGQDLWKSIKHWHNRKSGPEVNLLHLEFVALFMASSIWVQHNLSNSSLLKPTLVPLPSSPYSSSSPARTSNRLAQRISQLTGLQFKEVFEKRHGEIILVDKDNSRLESVILIDDQLTFGKTAEKCLKKIYDQIHNVELRVWTSQKFLTNLPNKSAQNFVPKPELAEKFPRSGQRVNVHKRGLGRIVNVDLNWMVIDFNSLGVFRYKLDSKLVEFLD